MEGVTDMAINEHDDYESLARLLYPSIEASGNVYYGQTRKLTMDEVLGKNDFGFESYIESERLAEEIDEHTYDYANPGYGFIYKKKFSWKLGPLHSTIDDYESNKDYDVYYVKYLLKISDKPISDSTSVLPVISSGNFPIYERNIELGDPVEVFTCGYEPDGISKWVDAGKRNFYIEKEGVDYYLYIAVPQDRTNEHGELTLHAINGDVTIKLVATGFTIADSTASTYAYEIRMDNTQWENYDGSLLTLQKNRNLSFRSTSNRPSFGNSNIAPVKYVTFEIKNAQDNDSDDVNLAAVEAYGQISSMNYNADADSPDTGAFCKLFQNCRILKRAPYLMKLGNKAFLYYSTFEGCYNLVNVRSDITGDTGHRGCYAMFRECKSLLIAPIIRCSSADSECFKYMFQGCSSLVLVACFCTSGITTSNFENWLNDTAPGGVLFTKYGTSWDAIELPPNWTNASVTTTSEDEFKWNWPHVKGNETLNEVTSFGSNSSLNGRGDITKYSTLNNISATNQFLDIYSDNKPGTYNADGSYNQEIWGYKCFNSPIAFRNGIYDDATVIAPSWDSYYTNSLVVSNIRALEKSCMITEPLIAGSGTDKIHRWSNVRLFSTDDFLDDDDYKFSVDVAGLHSIMLPDKNGGVGRFEEHRFNDISNIDSYNGEDFRWHLSGKMCIGSHIYSYNEIGEQGGDEYIKPYSLISSSYRDNSAINTAFVVTTADNDNVAKAVLGARYLYAADESDNAAFVVADGKNSKVTLKAGIGDGETSIELTPKQRFVRYNGVSNEYVTEPTIDVVADRINFNGTASCYTQLRSLKAGSDDSTNFISTSFVNRSGHTTWTRAAEQTYDAQSSITFKDDCGSSGSSGTHKSDIAIKASSGYEPVEDYIRRNEDPNDDWYELFSTRYKEAKINLHSDYVAQGNADNKSTITLAADEIYLNGLVSGAQISGTIDNATNLSYNGTHKLTAQQDTVKATVSIVPNINATAATLTGHDLGSQNYKWGTLYAYRLGESGTNVNYAYINTLTVNSTTTLNDNVTIASGKSLTVGGSTTLKGALNVTSSATTLGGSLTVTGETTLHNVIPYSNNEYNIGSSSAKWKEAYFTGGNRYGYYMTIDNTGTEPTIRPSHTNYGYLGTSDYHWYKSYVNQLYVNDNVHMWYENTDDDENLSGTLKITVDGPKEEDDEFAQGAGSIHISLEGGDNSGGQITLDNVDYVTMNSIGGGTIDASDYDIIAGELKTNQKISFYHRSDGIVVDESISFVPATYNEVQYFDFGYSDIKVRRVHESEPKFPYRDTASIFLPANSFLLAKVTVVTPSSSSYSSYFYYIGDTFTVTSRWMEGEEPPYNAGRVTNITGPVSHTGLGPVPSSTYLGFNPCDIKGNTADDVDLGNGTRYFTLISMLKMSTSGGIGLFRASEYI